MSVTNAAAWIAQRKSFSWRKPRQSIKPQARQRHEQVRRICEDWRATQPEAVTTFEREFEQTIRYYALEGMVREVVRTTSRLERTNRELRRKFRQVGCFSSPKGAEV